MMDGHVDSLSTYVRLMVRSWGHSSATVKVRVASMPVSEVTAWTVKSPADTPRTWMRSLCWATIWTCSDPDVISMVTSSSFSPRTSIHSVWSM